MTFFARTRAGARFDRWGMKTRARRVTFYVIMLCIAIGLIAWAAIDPHDYFSIMPVRSVISLIAAPLILLLFGRNLVRELRGEDTGRLAERREAR